MNAGFGLDPVPGLGRLTPENTGLRLLNGPKAKQQFPLQRMRTLIGRSDPPEVVVDLDLSDCELGDIPMISRRHAVIEWQQGELQIIDLASRNGTIVDGQPLKPAQPHQPSAPVALKMGSKLQLANLEFEVITHG